MGSISTSLLLLLFLVGYSAPQRQAKALQDLLQQQSEILQRLDDKERTIDNHQTMMETQMTMMETQQTMMQDIKSAMELLPSQITQDVTTQHSSLQQAIQDSIQEQFAGCIDEMPTTSGPKVKPVDCMGHKKTGSDVSGVFEIYPVNCSQPVSVWCDMETDGGGWTVFLNRKRQSLPEDFSRTWEDYKVGFGDPSVEYWLGNEFLHELTVDVPYILRADAEDFRGTQRHANWFEFAVGNSSSKYQLKVGQYQDRTSDVADFLEDADGQLFTTKDADNDANNWENCALEFVIAGNGEVGGWWFKDCGDVTPTGIIKETDRLGTSMAMRSWSYHTLATYSLSRMTMMMKPKDSEGPVRMCHE